jgi:type II secretory pathway pseudopilin PulG
MMVKRIQSSCAFTLLETLLAITVLASMSLLIAQAYRIAHESVSGGAHMERAVTVQRVLRLAADQWGDRRSVPLETTSAEEQPEDSGGPRLLPDRVGFITATPVINPRWPLVEATYRIVPSRNAESTAPLWDLVYEERPIASLQAARQAKNYDVSTLVVLSSCDELRMERLAPRDDPVRQANTAPIADEEVDGAEGDMPDRALAWIRFEIDPQTDVNGKDVVPPHAVRIVGRYQGEQFSCVFVVKVLH